MITRKASLFSVIAGVAFAAGCAHSDDSPALPGFHDVTDAPPLVQTAARAVVRIGTANEYGTGSFISPDGLLLTNNHVLGIDVCPVEGCYVDLSFEYQRGAPLTNPVTVYVVPLAIDVGLDIALVQTLDAGPTGPKFDSPDYLTLDARDAASLVGTHVHVVGHPESRIKKWTEGHVVDAQGEWIVADAYSLPGNSGSPILDDHGHMVGILHRGPSSQDMITTLGVNEYMIGSASAPIVAALAAPLPAGVVSVRAPTTDDDLVAHATVFRNARVATAKVDGKDRKVLDALGAACDKGLARTDYTSPDDLDAAVAPCGAAYLWIECRSDATGAFGSCPDDRLAWMARYASVNGRSVAMNKQLVLSALTFAPAALETTTPAGFARGAELLQAALDAVHPSLDFALANYMIQFGIESYGGRRMADYVNGYSGAPGYGLYGIEIASAGLALNHNGIWDGATITNFLHRVAGDENVDVAAKLYIDTVLYQSGAQ